MGAPGHFYVGPVCQLQRYGTPRGVVSPLYVMDVNLQILSFFLF